MNVFFLMALALGYFAQFVSPDEFSILAFFSLIYPYSVFGIFITGCVLIFLRSKLVWVSFLALVFSSATTVRQIGFHFQPDLPTDKNIFKIATLNVKNDFNHENTNQIEEFVNDFQGSLPDVFLFQEISRKKASYIQNALKYDFSSIDEHQRLNNSMAILCKYPLKPVDVLLNEENHPFAQIFDIEFPGKTVRAINVHLHTNAVTLRAEKFSPESISRKDGLKKLFEMIRSYGKNGKLRMQEIDKIIPYIKESPWPVLIAGDTNDTPYSRIYNELKGDFSDAFVKGGVGFAQTYNGLFIPLKIDHIFTDSNFCIYNTDIKKVDYSDHNPISTTFEFCKY